MEKVIHGRWERAEDLVGKIVDAVKEHSNGMRQFDDITTMVLSWH
jgi:serine phosphatase RsbU (regulator of sigma subunit)